jgi:hypothetical protein
MSGFIGFVSGRSGGCEGDHSGGFGATGGFAGSGEGDRLGSGRTFLATENGLVIEDTQSKCQAKRLDELGKIRIF